MTATVHAVAAPDRRSSADTQRSTTMPVIIRAASWTSRSTMPEWNTGYRRANGHISSSKWLLTYGNPLMVEVGSRCPVPIWDQA
jgi:hypothetical protein